ncbi:5-deoxy-glucuronate isomerase [Nocardioides panacis]|uniref:5-deoxy-glucuronate isomerase n=1 Tax=Nocardioides panacis TaxID=2849501 RepID=A0A975XZE3_9ACTN|nr:5-deoxy-glucuronate isomerase [Nocardioides panacis]QWZ07341.1 5-deoxy-glucuronate isomerase [Nocardioides panacis]
MSESRSQWFLPSGSARRDGCDVLVDHSLPGWQHTGLRVVTLDVGECWSTAEPGWEYVVVPLSGAASVACTDSAGTTHQAALLGRASVFAGSTDVAYVPAGSRLEVSGTAAGSRIAICAARVRDGRAETAFRHVLADEVPVELRGAGSCSREVRNFAAPGSLEADSIIAVEVVTPAGNWSSYPPHKHDEDRDGVETELEEIYYFETQVEGGAPTTGGQDPVGYQRVYGTAERPIDVFAEVRTGDVVLVPHGWHGPSMAAPGYDLYYLNVMAGPGDQRAWLICDDPSHGWVRQTWEGMAVDPRLPVGGEPR